MSFGNTSRARCKTSACWHHQPVQVFLRKVRENPGYAADRRQFADAVTILRSLHDTEFGRSLDGGRRVPAEAFAEASGVPLKRIHEALAGVKALGVIRPVDGVLWTGCMPHTDRRERTRTEATLAIKVNDDPAFKADVAVAVEEALARIGCADAEMARSIAARVRILR